MKKFLLNISYFAVTAMVLTLAGCVKTTEEDHNDKQINEWIYGEMKKEYFWRDNLPKSVDFNKSYEGFFYSLLKRPPKRESLGSGDPHDGGYLNDGSYSPYSYIEREPVTTRASVDGERSYGFDFVPYEVGSKQYYVRLIHIAKGSPAAEARLRRGDWIKTINGANVSDNNYKLLFPDESSSVTLGVSKTLEGGSSNVVLSAARVAENPVHKATYFELNNGKKIGYLAYMQFDKGVDSQDNTYDNALKVALKDLKANGVKDLILDLRYNPGGYVTCCQLLTSMLSPANSIASPEIFAYYKFGPNSNLSPLSLLTVEQMQGEYYGKEPGTNLNPNSVYVLVSESSASASEMIINALRSKNGLQSKLYIVGTQTEGKNVGSDLFEKEFGGQNYVMRPITFQIFNADKYSNYAKGFTPDHDLDEYEHYTGTWHDLGDQGELLTAAAIYHFEKGSFPVKTRAESLSATGIKKSGEAGSIAKKRIRGLMLAPELKSQIEQ